MKEPLFTKSKLVYYSVVGFCISYGIGNYFYTKADYFLYKVARESNK